MTNSLKTAIYRLRLYGNKITTKHGRVIALNGERVGKRSGIRSIDLERKILRLEKREVGEMTFYTKSGEKWVARPGVKSELSSEEISFRKKQIGLKRVRRVRRRYNWLLKRVKDSKPLRLTDKTLNRKLSDGESPEKIIADMKSNLLRSLDIAREGNIEALRANIALKRKAYPKTAKWLDSHPNLVLTDTHLYDAEQTIYDDTLSVEERDAKIVELLEEGSAIAEERMATLDSFYAFG